MSGLRNGAADDRCWDLADVSLPALRNAAV